MTSAGGDSVVVFAVWDALDDCKVLPVETMPGCTVVVTDWPLPATVVFILSIICALVISASPFFVKSGLGGDLVDLDSSPVDICVKYMPKGHGDWQLSLALLQLRVTLLKNWPAGQSINRRGLFPIHSRYCVQLSGNGSFALFPRGVPGRPVHWIVSLPQGSHGCSSTLSCFLACTGSTSTIAETASNTSSAAATVVTTTTPELVASY